jgi:hypothetical protein
MRTGFTLVAFVFVIVVATNAESEPDDAPLTKPVQDAWIEILKGDRVLRLYNGVRIGTRVVIKP